MIPRAMKHDRRAEKRLNVWDFYHLDRGRELPCGNVRTFLYYITSPGTQVVDLEGSSAASRNATLRLSGPRVGDGQPLTVRYRLDRTVVHEVLG